MYYVYMKYLVDSINNYKDIDLNIIKSNKRERISKYSRLDKLRSYIGEILLIKGFKEYYNIDYNNINIIYNKYGKPYIENSNIYFNISHSNEYVIVVFSDKEIGVDIEYIHGNINTMNIFCNKLEKEYINGEITKLFDVFTYKEAYIKMLGTSIINIKEINYFDNTNINIYKPIIDNYSINIIEKRN